MKEANVVMKECEFVDNGIKMRGFES